MNKMIVAASVPTRLPPGSDLQNPLTDKAQSHTRNPFRPPRPRSGCLHNAKLFRPSHAICTAPVRPGRPGPRHRPSRPVLFLEITATRCYPTDVSAAGKLLAVLLALLVANPVCCCTIQTLLGNKAAPALPSCCAKKAQQQNQSPDRNKQAPSCPCAKSRTALLESKAAAIEPLFNAVPALVPSLSLEPIFTPVAALRETSPSVNLPPSPPKWRLHCRYLL